MRGGVKRRIVDAAIGGVVSAWNKLTENGAYAPTALDELGYIASCALTTATVGNTLSK